MEKPFKCPECPFRSKHKRNIKIHVQGVHRSARPFPCSHPGCQYTAKQQKHLKQHLIIHTREKAQRKSRPKIHSVKKFCSHPNCTFSTKSKQALRQHTRVHTGEKPWVCQFESCSYAATQQFHLVSHSRTHTKEKPFKCPEPNCEYSATERGQIKRHQLNRHPKEGEELPSFSCPLCEYSGKCKDYLTSHIRNKHTLENPFKCEEPNCNFESRRKDEVEAHKKENCNDRPFPCSFESCGYRSKSKSGLSFHLRSHSEERPYKCGLCPFRGKTRASAARHFKELHAHSDLRPFKCTEPKCGSSFKRNASLKEHLLYHKGDKKYNCLFPDCGYKAVLQSVVNKHVKKVHQVEKRSNVK